MDMYEKLVECISGRNTLAVAFSGGADSTLLLCAAIEALGRDAVRAYTFVSELTPEGDPLHSREGAEYLGAEHSILTVNELEDQNISANGRLRCYHCKRRMFSLLLERAAQDGFENVAEGTNSDDAAEYRPGLRAISELGILSPLRDCGFTKRDVRGKLRKMGVPAHSRPSSPCLATRIPYGTRLTKELLQTVDRGEMLLKSAGFPACRLRHHGDTARIEVPPEDFSKLLASNLAAKIKELGFTYVTLDLEGLRSGSMDEVNDGHKGTVRGL